MRPLRFLLSAFLAIGVAVSVVRDAAAQAPLRLVVLGDSLSSGLLIPRSQAFPAVLETTLRQRGFDVTVTNAAISGDTTLGGLSRVDRDVPAGTSGVILELGANDMLRREPAENMRANLEQIVRRLRARGIPVLLAGLRLSPTSGADIVAYEAAFQSVARRNGLVYYPDFYAGLAADPSYRIFDRTHPSPAGVQVIVAGILPTVTRFVAGLGRRDGSSGGRARVNARQQP